MTPNYRMMGEAAAAEVSRRRNPQERLNRDDDQNSEKKVSGRNATIPRFFRESGEHKCINYIVHETGRSEKE
jgi:hypothetical protein